jgi:hypothetical protein
MELFQMKISAEGKLQETVTGKSLFADEDKALVRAAREINDGSEEYSSTASSSTNGGEYKSYNSSQVSSNYNNYTSPKNVSQPALLDPINLRSTQSIEERMKTGLMKKPSGVVDEGETTVVTSPMRKIKLADGGTALSALKEKVLKFHQEIVRGVNIVRSMGLNNERNTPLFTFFIFKDISDKMKKYK